jgi:PucR C-terminal helix-turn-helix domain/GGDEF-like domain
LIAGDPVALRSRVSWPVIARSTGLGLLEGGEAVLVPPARIADVLERLEELERAGVVMLTLAGEPTDEQIDRLQIGRLPTALLSIETDLNEVRSDIERFIARRRRELFATDQELHRVLVEAAIAGTPVEELVGLAAQRTGATALLEREGKTLIRPRDARLPDSLLRQLRTAITDPRTSHVLVAGPPRSLVSPVATAQTIRGFVALIDVDERSLDAQEAAVASLASACAIALSQEPSPTLPSLSQVISGPPGGLFTATPWTAAALACPPSMAHGLSSALRAEMDGRNIANTVILDSDTLVLLAATPDRFSWDSLVSAVGTRMAFTDLRLGLSRVHKGTEAADEAVRQSLEALARGGEDTVTRYELVELEALLGSLRGADAFVRARLGALMDGSAGNSELLLTLSEYLRSGRNAKEAANNLAVHRNTLIYRLRRLEKVLGIDWRDADEIFSLDLAIRLMNGSPSRFGRIDSSSR